MSTSKIVQGSTGLQATVEDCSDSDSGVVDTNASHNPPTRQKSNTSIKRKSSTKPTDAPSNASDSGYSSRTAATFESASSRVSIDKIHKLARISQKLPPTSHKPPSITSDKKSVSRSTSKSRKPLPMTDPRQDMFVEQVSASRRPAPTPIDTSGGSTNAHAAVSPSRSRHAPPTPHTYSAPPQLVPFQPSTGPIPRRQSSLSASRSRPASMGYWLVDTHASSASNSVYTSAALSPSYRQPTTPASPTSYYSTPNTYYQEPSFPTAPSHGSRPLLQHYSTDYPAHPVSTYIDVPYYASPVVTNNRHSMHEVAVIPRQAQERRPSAGYYERIDPYDGMPPPSRPSYVLPMRKSSTRRHSRDASSTRPKSSREAQRPDVDYCDSQVRVPSSSTRHLEQRPERFSSYRYTEPQQESSASRATRSDRTRNSSRHESDIEYEETHRRTRDAEAHMATKSSRSPTKNRTPQPLTVRAKTMVDKVSNQTQSQGHGHEKRQTHNSSHAGEPRSSRDGARSSNGKAEVERGIKIELPTREGFNINLGEDFQGGTFTVGPVRSDGTAEVIIGSGNRKERELQYHRDGSTWSGGSFAERAALKGAGKEPRTVGEGAVVQRKVKAKRKESLVTGN